MMMMVWTWRYRRTLLNQPLRFGLLLGLAHEFRPPDTLIWLIAPTSRCGLACCWGWPMSFARPTR